MHMQSCGVYHLKCSNCNVDYISKTSRQVKRRFEEHKSGSQKDETYDSACFDHEKRLIIKLITKILKF
jgi:predicted GIY-YIG superfamily endonuclease